MNKLVAKKWVKALRSGKYKQGQGHLKQINERNVVEHCCLGVLCELYDEEMKKKHKRTLTKGTGYDFGVLTFNKKEGILPSVVQKWAGMKSDIGEYGEKSYGLRTSELSLVVLNDNNEKSFKYIANTIEKNVEKL